LLTGQPELFDFKVLTDYYALPGRRFWSYDRFWPCPQKIGGVVDRNPEKPYG
jgi:hypothetical protein